MPIVLTISGACSGAMWLSSVWSLIFDELERIKMYVLVWIAGASGSGVAAGIVAFVAYDRG